jgi:hypothetical protein
MTGKKRYVFEVPRTVPDGCRVVHNQVIYAGELGLNGFRCWLQQGDDPPLVECDCRFAADRGYTHYCVDLDKVRTAREAEEGVR